MPDPTDRIGIYLSQHATEIGANSGLGDGDLLVTHLHFTGTKLYPAGICSGGCIIAVDSSVYSQVQINAGFSLRF